MSGTERWWVLPAGEVVEPFGKVVLRQRPDGRVWVRAYLLVDQGLEGVRTGLAIDGSGTMMPGFGVQRKGAPNIISPFVRAMCTYLAERVDAGGAPTVIYWATGADGRAIEELGPLSAGQLTTYEFTGPRNYGDFTCLAPAVRYFVERFTGSWGLYLFITDGRIDDLEDVKGYTRQLAQEIADGRRPGLKLVLIGVGHRVDEAQMAELDNLETGTRLDLWDYRLASSMQQLAEVFAEVVDERMIVAPRGMIKDDRGQVVKDYRDTGVPALLEFDLPAGSRAFTLEIEGQAVMQPVK